MGKLTLKPSVTLSQCFSQHPIANKTACEAATEIFFRELSERWKSNFNESFSFTLYPKRRELSYVAWKNKRDSKIKDSLESHILNIFTSTKTAYLLYTFTSDISHLMETSDTTNFVNFIQEHNACKNSQINSDSKYCTVTQVIFIYNWVIFYKLFL